MLDNTGLKSVGNTRHLYTNWLFSRYLKNNISDSVVLYGFSQLNRDFHKACRIRRSSDNSEQDFGFDEVGNFDQVSLISFLGGSTAYLTKWYDQSGNSNDAVQTTASLQPVFLSNSITFDLVDDKLEIPVPNTGFSGSCAAGFIDGSYIVEVEKTSGTYDIGHYLADDKLVGFAIFNKVLGPIEDDIIINSFTEAGADNKNGWSSVTNFSTAWRNHNLTSFPFINTSSGTNFYTAWYGNKLTSFPFIDTSSGTNFSSTWRTNNLTSFPAIDLSSGLTFYATWSDNNLTSFPLMDMSSGTNFYATWYNNNLTSFPAIDMSSGIDFSATWSGNNLTSFPAVDMSSGTYFRVAWYNNNLTSFPANLFDSLSSPLNDCFVNTFAGTNVIDQQGMENILVSIDTSGANAPASGVDITISSNGDSLSAATSTAITNLKIKGWTITIDGTPQ